MNGSRSFLCVTDLRTSRNDAVQLVSSAVTATPFFSRTRVLAQLKAADYKTEISIPPCL